jgi:phosphodiesterase/alkaline phosphatase D-like protein
MRRTPLAVLALIALSAAFPAGASAAFKYGVAAGEVTSNSAKLWAHSTKSGFGTVAVSRTRSFRRPDFVKNTRASASSDNNMQVTVKGLKPNTTYYFRFNQNRPNSAVGKFKTAPKANQNATIRFAWSGDADAQRAKGQSKPFYNNFQVYDRMRRENNNFNINLGDTIYSDSEVGAKFVNGVYTGFDPALTRKQKWAKYQQNLALTNLQKLRDSAVMYSHPDDHEWINDFARGETLVAQNSKGQTIQVPGNSIYKAGVQAFMDYAPTTWSASKGFYRSFRWGKNLEVFFLDERSFRSPKAGSPTVHTCDNPQSHSPDLAPTAPQSARSLFGAVVPSLNQPVSQQCKDAINDPSRTMLGAAQYARFTSAIKRSTATWKVIINEVPIEELYELPYDRWEGYAAERTKLMQFLQQNVKNTVFLTTDHHGNLVNEVQTNTLQENGTPTTHYGILDIATGPVATQTFRKEINSATGQDADTGSNGGLVDAAFFEPAPPGGLGMDPAVNKNSCSSIDVYSYGQVSASPTQLTVTLKDINGQPVKNENGAKAQCGPYVLTKQ